MIASLLLALGTATAPAAAPADEAEPVLLAPAPLEREQYAAWSESVATEACTPGPVHTPAPAYPYTAMRNEASGRVVLGLFINRCGDVRDAWVMESSGSRDIDRAAVRAALKWKASPPADGAATATARVAIDFDLAPEA
ncbi:energy transducer TonB [Arenimonas sp.]|uniref:energy transducer TonB n=1 Tax=Arenimonas sp. TaxID=1872635 RepID=UPI0025F317C8|nr:energy transducer TonB [Arenimonas sp.]